MKARWLGLMACAVVFGAGSSNAAGTNWVEPDDLLTAKQSMEHNMLGVAEALGISQEEARRILNVQEHSGELAERLRAQYSDRLAGIYLEHEPSSRLVVRLTGHDAVRPQFHQFGADSLEVAFDVGAEHTFASLQKRFDAGFPQLGERVKGLQGGYVDERTGEIVIEVVHDGKNTGLAEIQRTAEGIFGVPSRLVELAEPTVQQAVFGGGLLDYAWAGSNWICTGGFIVRQPPPATLTGTLTAGHCQATGGIYSYTGHDAATHSLTNAGSLYNNLADIRWARPVPVTGVGPWVWTGSAYEQVTGRRTQASTNVGNVICKWGRTGGYGCATVFSKAYNPGSICGPAVPGTAACSATFVGLNSSAGLCQGGDSGGPWFIAVSGGVVAAGIHSAGNPTAGLCVYTSTDYAYSHLGLQLVY